MKRNYFMVGLVFIIFFVISLLTNVQGPLLPDIITAFSLSLGMAGFLPFSFFLAYGVMSIPAGMAIERFNEKPVLLIAFAGAFAGCCLFVLNPVYANALLSLFTIGLGMAMLQVAINPLLRVAGGEEHYAFFGVMAQLIFGLASFFSPYLYSYLVAELGRPAAVQTGLTGLLAKVVPPALPWLSMYWIFTVVTLIMVLILAAVRIPRVELTEAEKAGSLATHLALFKDKLVLLYFFGTFSYVGLEQGVAIWISKFLQEYHMVDPAKEGAMVNSNFWLMQTLGCVLGLVLLKIFDSRKVLVAFGVLAGLSLAAALFGSKEIAMLAFPAVGFWTSVMWATIFSLALNSVEKHHGSFSGILVTGIVGGAVVPWLVGRIGDFTGLRLAMLAIFIPAGYIISIGFWARPLINNATLGGKKKTVAEN